MFFDRLPNLFKDNQIEIDDIQNGNIVSKPKEDYVVGKLLEITDKQLLSKIKPLLKKNRVLEVVEICTKHYSHKYKSMNFKDWFKLVNDLYQKNNTQV